MWVLIVVELFNIAVNDFDAKNSRFSRVLLVTELVVSGTPCMIDADYYHYKFLQDFLAAICDLYRPQRSWGKVMFLQASVILSRGGVSHCMLGYHPPPPGPDPPPLQAHTQGGSDPDTHPRGKLRGIRSRSTPKGEIEGDQIQAHTQGGRSDPGPYPRGGDQVQANIQGGNSGGSGPTPPPPPR